MNNIITIIIRLKIQKNTKNISKILDIFFIYDIINNQGKGSDVPTI